MAYRKCFRDVRSSFGTGANVALKERSVTVLLPIVGSFDHFRIWLFSTGLFITATKSSLTTRSLLLNLLTPVVLLGFSRSQNALSLSIVKSTVVKFVVPLIIEREP